MFVSYYTITEITITTEAEMCLAHVTEAEMCLAHVLSPFLAHIPLLNVLAYVILNLTFPFVC